MSLKVCFDMGDIKRKEKERESGERERFAKKHNHRKSKFSAQTSQERVKKQTEAHLKRSAAYTRTEWKRGKGEERERERQRGERERERERIVQKKTVGRCVQGSRALKGPDPLSHPPSHFATPLHSTHIFTLTRTRFSFSAESSKMSHLIEK